jgi:hypothetical protein
MLQKFKDSVAWRGSNKYFTIALAVTVVAALVYAGVDVSSIVE